MERSEPSSRGASIDAKLADWCRALRPPVREDEVEAALVMLRAFARANDLASRHQPSDATSQGEE